MPSAIGENKTSEREQIYYGRSGDVVNSGPSSRAKLHTVIQPALCCGAVRTHRTRNQFILRERCSVLFGLQPLFKYRKSTPILVSKRAWRYPLAPLVTANSGDRLPIPPDIS